MDKRPISRQELVLRLMHDVKTVPNDAEELKACMVSIFHQLKNSEKFPALVDDNISTQEFSAIEFACGAHLEQKRRTMPYEDGTPRPYAHHLVHAWLVSLVSGLSADARTAMILHDVAEDLPENKPDWDWQPSIAANVEFGVDIIRNSFGDRVADLVDIMSNRWPDSDPQKAAKRMQMMLDKQDPEAMMMKLCDRAANMYDASATPQNKHEVTSDYISLFHDMIQSNDTLDLEAYYDCFIKISAHTHERLNVGVMDRAEFLSLSALAERYDDVVEKHGLTLPNTPEV